MVKTPTAARRKSKRAGGAAALPPSTPAKRSVAAMKEVDVEDLEAMEEVDSDDDGMAKKNRDSYEPYDVTSLDFKAIGSEIMNRSEEHSKFDRSWISFFGVEPLVYAEVWHRLDLVSLAEEDDVFKSAEPMHLLWAGLFATTYPTESILIKICGCDSEDTLWKWVWLFIEAVSNLVDEVVSVLVGVITHTAGWCLSFSCSHCFLHCHLS